MSNFTTDTYVIEDTKLLRIYDDEDYWYPLQSFFNKILLTRCNIQRYRDSEKYMKFMRVYEFVPLNATNSYPLKTWCVSTEGMYLILMNITIMNDNFKKTQVRERRLNAARMFFGVKVKNPSMFLEYTPDIENYDIWSILCIKHDLTLKATDVWKRCDKCGYYYPATDKYFAAYKNGIYSQNCLQCRGGNFKCDNKVIQYLYTHNGLDLLFQYYLQNKEKTYEELQKFIDRGGA